MRKKFITILLTAVLSCSAEAAPVMYPGMCSLPGPLQAFAAEAEPAAMASGLASFAEGAGKAGEETPASETEESALSSLSGDAQAQGSPVEGTAASQAIAGADESETDPDGAVMDENKFLQDIKAANEARAEESSRYTGAEVAAMTNQEIADMNLACLDTEKDLYETYAGAVFRNKNLQYLCDLYMKGLKNQFDAYDSWEADADISSYNELWNAGYNKRALALVEIADTYSVEIPDLDDMRKTAESLSGNNEEAATDLSAEEVRQAQDDLNTLGFVNTADGNYGSRTAELVHRFQVMYGYSPADGALDKESLGQLDEEAKKVLPPETSSETESETEA